MTTLMNKHLLIATVTLALGLSESLAQFTFTRVVSTVTPVPGGTGPFDFMAYPGTDGQAVYFNGADQANRYGVFGGTGGALTTLVDWTTPIPGASGTFELINRPNANLGRVGFAGGNATVSGLYLASGGAVQRIADNTLPLPDGGGMFTSFNDWSVGSWGVAFRANANTATEGIYRHTATGLASVATFQTPVPGGGGSTFQYLDNPVAEASGLTFFGNNLKEGDTRRFGIYRATASGALQLVIGNTDIDPGSGTPYSSFGGQAVNPAGQLAVVAASALGAFTSLRFWTGDQWTTLAQEGTPVPGSTNAHFDHFYSHVSLDEWGNVAFHADDDSGNTGIYLATGGQLLKVVDLNTPIEEGKTLLDEHSLGLADNQMAGGMLAFYAVTGPGEFGIYMTSVPKPAPRLRITAAPGTVSLFWPTNATGFRLQQAATLPPAVAWSYVTNTPTTLGAEFQVQLGRPDSAGFYRLVKTGPPIVGHFFSISCEEVSDQAVYDRADAAPWDKMSEVYLTTLQTRGGNGGSRTGEVIYNRDDSNDGVRINTVMQKIHARNPACRMFLVLWWGANQIGEVCDNPQTFMTSFQKIVDAHKGNGGISGLVIDWETDGNTTPAKLDSFISLYRNTFPGLELRVCPDTFDQGLQDLTVTKKLDYLMPQSYQQWDPSLSRANQAISLIGTGKVIVGMESERRPQDPVSTYVNYYKQNSCAGIFVWRLDNDDVDSKDFPRFTLAKALWPAINDL